MDVTRDGLRLDLALKEGTELPLDSAMYVHNLSAVGEQYLDFEPQSGKGPYAGSGDTIEGNAASLPVDEGDLLIELDDFVSSVDRDSLEVTVRELGLMFNDTGVPLQKLLDSGGKFIDEASAHEDETVALLQNGLTVLRTQRDEGENIRTLSRDLNLITRSLRRSDDDLRGTLQDTPAAVREVDALLQDLEPDPAGAARQRGQRRPGRGLAPRRPRAAAGDVPAHDRERLHRHARQQRRPGEPPVLEQGAAVHRRLQAEQPVAAGRRALRRADLPGRSATARRRTTCAAPSTPPAARATRARPDASTARRTTRALDWSRGQWTLRATPYDSSTRGTCRCWEEIRGSGCWWGR